MDQRKKRWAIFAGASAALVLCAGASNAFLHPVAPPSSTSPTVAQASILDDADEDDSCSDPAQTAQLMAMAKGAGQKQTIVASSDARRPAQELRLAATLLPRARSRTPIPAFIAWPSTQQSSQVIISDSNRGAIFSYDRAAGGNSSQPSPRNGRFADRRRA